MDRGPRNEIQGIHHVYARGNNRQRIFRGDRDRTTYLLQLARVTVRMRWRLLAYCLMDNHVHLLVETRAPNLGSGMRRLHSLYARTFNDRHRRSGHLFQGRYGSRLVEYDEQLWATVAYIARNPVDAGMCDSPARHRWSSHRLVIREEAPAWLDVRRLLERFEGVGGDPRVRYRELIDGPALPRNRTPAPAPRRAARS
jgi:putative transposase